MDKLHQELWEKVNNAILKLSSLAVAAGSTKLSTVDMFDKFICREGDEELDLLDMYLSIEHLYLLAIELEEGICAVIGDLGTVEELQKDSGVMVASEEQTKDGRLVTH
jgi:hypothetical protein